MRFVNLFMLLISVFSLRGEGANQARLIDFRPIATIDNLPSTEVIRIIQDANGFLWIATNNGLCRYDGYRLMTYKDNLYHPGLLTDNAVKCLAEDRSNHLWIGTSHGLNRMDLTTGTIGRVTEMGLDNKEIAVVHVSRDNHVWVGGDEGLFHYDPDEERWTLHCPPDEPGYLGVKSILEDSERRLWVGTWRKGLFRFDRATRRFIAYPPFAGQNSAHVIYEDSRRTLWVGSWGQGLHRLSGMATPETALYRRYVHRPDDPYSLSDNTVYCIAEERQSGTLWIGTRNGLSLLAMDDPAGRFLNYLPEDKERNLPYNELDALWCDHSGMMWLGMVGGGVYNANTRHLNFRSHPLETLKEEYFSNSVRSLFMDRDETLWIGLGSHGLALQSGADSQPVYYRDHPGFKDAFFHTVNHISGRKQQNHILFATWGNGLLVYDKEKRTGALTNLHTGNTPWLQDDFIFYAHEDSRENIWLGCRSGVSVYLADGSGVNLNDCLHEKTAINPTEWTFYSILETRDGTVWLGANNGIIRVKGNPRDPHLMEYTLYTDANGKLPYQKIQCLYEDAKGILWAGSEGGGLMAYGAAGDCFEPLNTAFGLLADGIYTMQDDKAGNLWLGTNNGLMRLAVTPAMQLSSLRTYTHADGLLNNAFIRNAATKAADGRLFVGGHNGYNSYQPEKMTDTEQQTPVAITDIYIFNTPLSQLPPGERKKITSAAPTFTDRVTLSYKQNNFGIEFSSLSFINPGKNKYAYQLSGYDAGWQYVDATHRRANYTNLPAGKYTFLFKGTDVNGVWNDARRPLQVVILPPPWRTWWAYGLYCLLLCLTGYGVYAIIRTRVRHRQAEQMYELELAKMQEVNEANLLRLKEQMKWQLVIQAKELDFSTLDDDFLQQAIDCVHRHLDDTDFGQQQFAEEMKMGKTTLYTKLKTLTGLNTSAFIRSIRLKVACRILEERSDIRISDLAYFVGFGDPKYFSTCFKKEFGMQPKEYAEKRKED